MKVNVLVKIARQVLGDYILIQAEKASTDVNKLQDYMTKNQIPARQEMQRMDCYVEWGVLTDIEVDSE